MDLLKNYQNLNKSCFKISSKVNIYFLLLTINFITYSIYAVLSRYNILLIEILINLNFIIFFYFYRKYPNNNLRLDINFKIKEIIFFIFLLLGLFIILSKELNLPLFSDEIATTRRASRTAFFASFLFLDLFNINFLKEIPLKYIIHLLSFIQILFIIWIIFILKNKNTLGFIFVLMINLILRFIIKDSVHHPPLNHIFTTGFISLFGLSHFVVRISYLIPFWIFLIFLYKMISRHLSENISLFFILSISTMPILALASSIPDHSIWSTIIFIYLLCYLYLNDKIDYKFCILIISIGILFRISIFSAFVLVGVSFIASYLNKKSEFLKEIKYLIFKEKVFIFILLFLPLFLVSILGTPAYEGINNSDSFELFYKAVKSKIILYSIIKQIPPWYYPFLFLIFFTKKRIEFLIFFIINLLIYFSIQEGLWGNAKYVLEYAIPFLILGHLILIKILYLKKKIILINLLSLLFLFLNLNEIIKFPKSRISFDEMYENGYEKIFKSDDKNTKYFLTLPYRYDDAFEYIKKINAKEKTLFFGTTYGFYPEILENYNFKELIKLINLKNEFDSLNNSNYSLSNKILNVEKNKTFKDTFKNYLQLMKKSKIFKSNNIDSNNTSNINDIFLKLGKLENLNYILLADYGDRKLITNNLLSKNWEIEKKFIEKDYQSTLILFKKKP